MADTTSTPDSARAVSGRIRLTKLGDLAVRHGTLTPPEFYTDTVVDAEAHGDAGGEPLDVISERIAGLTELLARYSEITEEGE